MKNPEACVINGGKITSYFKLQRGDRQGVPISVHLSV